MLPSFNCVQLPLKNPRVERIQGDGIVLSRIIHDDEAVAVVDRIRK